MKKIIKGTLIVLVSVIGLCIAYAFISGRTYLFNPIISLIARIRWVNCSRASKPLPCL